MADYKAILDRAVGEAKNFIEDPSKLDGLMGELETKLKGVPAIGEARAAQAAEAALKEGYITEADRDGLMEELL